MVQLFWGCRKGTECNAPVLLTRDGASFPESFLEGLPESELEGKTAPSRGSNPGATFLL